MAVGGDQYESFVGKKAVNEYETIEEILGAYIKENGITHKTVDGRVFAGTAEAVGTEVEVVATPEIEKVEKVEKQTEIYVVQSGDTLGKISKKTGFSINEILKENKEITNPDILFSGEKISLPKAN